MKTIINLTLLLIAQAIFGQSTFLTIDQGSTMTDQASYPPGTKFELINKKGEVVYNQKANAGIFEIDQPYTLTMYPNWKNTTDVYYLTEGELILAEAPVYKSKSYESDNGYSSYGVTVLKKTLSNSEKFYGLKNLYLEFSDGVVFKYIDQETSATLDGKALEIKSKYLIYSKLGIHKVSFNPENGKTYWVFEPTD